MVENTGQGTDGGGTTRPEEIIETLAAEERALSTDEVNDVLIYYEERLRREPKSEVLWNNKGVLLDKLGRHDDALGCYDKAITLNPKYDVGWFNKGNNLCYQGRFDEAVQAYEIALSINARDEESLTNVVYTLIDSGQWARALALFDAALDAEPENARLWFCKGLLMESNDRLRKAESFYKRAELLEPKFHLATITRGNLLFMMGRAKEALEAYESSMKDIEADEEIMNNVGYIYFSMGNMEEALRHYDQAIELDPDYKPAWYNKGYTLQAMNMLPEARKCYDRALELDRTDRILWNNRGNAEYNMRSYETSIPFFEEALHLSPVYDVAINNIGNALDKMKRHREALAYHIWCLEVNPRFDYALYAKGTDLGKLGRPEEGLVAVDRSLELNPNYEHTWLSKGDILRELERYDEALECYDKAIELVPDFKEAWAEKGRLLDYLGREEEAEECLEKAIKAFDIEINQFARDNHLKMAKGEFLMELWRHSEALDVFEVLCTIEPNNADAPYWKGMALMALDEPENALGAFDKALSVDGDHAQALRQKGRALAAMGRQKEGVVPLRAAMEKAPLDFAIAHDLAGTLYEAGDHKSAVNVCDRAIQVALAVEKADSALNDRFLGPILKLDGKFLDTVLADIGETTKGAKGQGKDKSPAKKKGGLTSFLKGKASLEEQTDIGAIGMKMWDRVKAITTGPSTTGRVLKDIIEGAGKTDGKDGAELLRLLADTLAFDIDGLGPPAHEVIATDGTRLTDTLVLKGLAQVGLGDLKDASATLVKALELDPTNEVAWTEDGFINLNLKAYKDAMHSFDRAIGLDEDHEYAWYGKAMALAENGQRTKALKYLDVVLDMAPGHGPATALKARLEKGKGTPAREPKDGKER